MTLTLYINLSLILLSRGSGVRIPPGSPSKQADSSSWAIRFFVKFAFLGNIIITDYSKWIYGIVWALGGYSIGAVCSAVIAFFSYLSQSSYNDEDEQSHKNADKNRFVAMIFAILGITLFVISSVIVGVTIRCYWRHISWCNTINLYYQIIQSLY